MIDILHRETSSVILTVEGEWRNGYNLPYAFLDGIDLRGAILVDADLTDAYLSSANLTEADLSGAILRRADCHSITFRRANLTNADLSYTTLQSSDWRGAVLTGANLSRATMKSGRYDQFTIWPQARERRQNRIGHELVEGCTDPQWDAFQKPNGNSFLEIGDLNENDPFLRVNGVLVQPYWSNSDNGGVLPVNPDLLFQNANSPYDVAFWEVAGTTFKTSTNVSVAPGAGYNLVGSGDFAGNCQRDLVYQNQNKGQIVLWYLNGGQYLSGAVVSPTPAPGYKVVGIGDFNGDGHPDFILQNASGQTVIWYMNNAQYLGGVTLGTTPGASYKLIGVADFNGDGYPDLVYQDLSTGLIYFFLLQSGGQVTGIYQLPQSAQTGYVGAGVADTNNDGSPDLIFQNQNTGQVIVWYMNGLVYNGGGLLSLAPASGYFLHTAY